ncbi:AAA family ATPase [Thalassobium sp. R2A62]|uniref:AAA family ATPase n=1 Tax=Thalassobium sp. R2A62 TaxID=633131 RepID=UPI00350E476E
MAPDGGGPVPLYRVNVAGLVSKYIGEKAKNFACVFEAVRRSGAALLFDGVEGLFGKRTTQVKDSNDKHSNAELGFLLQCLEAYPGIACLTLQARDFAGCCLAGCIASQTLLSGLHEVL